jgi:hypothetical protein
MSDHAVVTHPRPGGRDESLGQLVSQVAEQTSRLVKDELRLAQAELLQKAKKAGLGVGLFGSAGVFALYGFGCLVTAAILALAGPLASWLAALIVAGVLFAVVGAAALLGRREIAASAPPVPREAVAGMRQDVHTLTSGTKR